MSLEPGQQIQAHASATRHLAAPPRRDTRAKSTPQPAVFSHGGQDIPYQLKTSARARRIRLVIRAGNGLEVTMPHGTSTAYLEQVLRDKVSWILATLRRVAEHEQPARPPLAYGSLLRYRGGTLRLALRRDATGRARVMLRDGVLWVCVAENTQELIELAIERWYRRQARDIFAERIAHCNASYGFSYGRVSIKDQKSRWGSCSRKGNLNFNWRLVLAPPDVLDYVVYHELAHLREPNHAPPFWALVAQACPDYRAQRLWLRQHGHELRI